MSYKPLLLIAENEKGELVAIRISEGDNLISTGDSDVPLGSVVEAPSPKQVKLEEDLERQGQDLQDVLDKYKEKK